MKEVQEFTGYEYKTMEVRKKLEQLWVDSYTSYGWELTKKEPAIVKHVWGPLRVMMAPLALLPGTPFSKMIINHESEEKTSLTFRRNRQIENKAELNGLQHQFDINVKEIDRLETAKKTGPATISYTVGLAGTVWMGLATFAYLSGNVPACVIFAVPGILGWVLPAFIYKGVKKRKTGALNPMIEQHYDAINQINEQGYGLI